jgi:hypothetical protein
MRTSIISVGYCRRKVDRSSVPLNISSMSGSGVSGLERTLTYPSSAWLVHIFDLAQHLLIMFKNPSWTVAFDKNATRIANRELVYWSGKESSIPRYDVCS